MRAQRTLAATGVVAAVLINSSMAWGAVADPSPVPSAKAVSITEPVPTIESGIPATISRAVTDDQERAAQSAPEQVPICGTGFGTPGSSAALSWDDTTGAYKTAAAADFYCPSTFKITSVDVMGYYGAQPTATFNITVYYDAGGEPDNVSPAKCGPQTVTGTFSGVYGNPQQVTLPLNPPCTVTTGTYWLEVQEVDPVEPWYWQTQTTTGGTYDADWREYGTSQLGTFCTAGYLDGYDMQDCLFLTGEPDLMFVLTGDPPNPCTTVDQITPLFASTFGAPSMTTPAKGQAADDFSCAGAPSGTSDVNTLTWKGRYGTCSSGTNCGPAAYFQVTVYANGGTNEPGSIVCSRSLKYAPGWPATSMPGRFQESPAPKFTGLKTFQATLSTPCTVTNGTTYWLSLTAKIGGNVLFNWERGILGASQVAGAFPADWYKTTLGTCTMWNNGIYLYQPLCLGAPNSAKNLLFRIN